MPRLDARVLRLVVHAAAALPLAALVFDYWRDQLTVNPIQYVTFRTGKAALVSLVLSLACTPLRSLTGRSELIALRKPLGLWAFAYAAMHLMVFVGLDYGFDPELIVEAVFEKRYALVGFSAFVILSALAATSTRGWMRRLGRNWKLLHRAVYAAALLAVVHFVWLVKSDVREPLAYGGAVAVLLLARVPRLKRAGGSLRDALLRREAGYQPSSKS